MTYPGNIEYNPDTWSSYLVPTNTMRKPKVSRSVPKKKKGRKNGQYQARRIDLIARSYFFLSLFYEMKPKRNASYTVDEISKKLKTSYDNAYHWINAFSTRIPLAEVGSKENPDTGRLRILYGLMK